MNFDQKVSVNIKAESTDLHQVEIAMFAQLDTSVSDTVDKQTF